MKKIIDSALDILRVVDRFDVEEVDVEVGGRRYHLSKGAPAPEEPPPAAAKTVVSETTPQPPPPPEPQEDANLAAIVSPMVGTFYRRPDPNKPPFVEVGQIVEVDQPVCIIEAMKLMNIIKSNVRGKIVKILVENQTPVQSAQKLILVGPAE